MANPNDNIRRLYQNGLKHFSLPDFDTFQQDMKDEQKRRRFYNSMQSAYDLPDFDTFSQDIGAVAPPAPAQPAAQPQSAAPTSTTVQPVKDNTAQSAAVQPTVTSTAQPAQPEGWKPSPVQMQAMKDQMDASMKSFQKTVDEGRQRLENVRKGTAFNASQGVREFNPQTGKMETAYYTVTGDRVASRLEQSRRNTEYNNWWYNNTEEGKRSKALHDKWDDDARQQVFDTNLASLWQRNDPDNAAEAAWQSAESKYSAAIDRNRANADFMVSNFAMNNTDAAAIKQMESVDNFADRLTTHDLNALMDAAWNNLGEERQKAIIDDCYQMLLRRYPGCDDIVAYNQAKELARHQSDLRMYNLAVAKNAPKSALEYFMRKVQDANLMTSIGKGLAVNRVGKTGDMAAYEAANQQYEEDGHKILGFAGTITGMVADPAMLVSGGVGGAFGKGSLWVGGRYLATRGAAGIATKAATQAAKRQFATSMSGRLAAGMVGGAANFGTYEGIKEMENQFVHGGHVVGVDDTGHFVNEGYSASAVGGQMLHGAIMGAAVGWITPVSGNVSDAFVRGTSKNATISLPGISSTAGKVVTRAGVYTGATTLEGTIFSIPEWYENAQKDDGDPTKRAAMDVWTDNMAMMVGFKGKHILKSAGNVLGDLHASFEHPTNGRKNRHDFEARLRQRMDAPSNPLELTKDEKAELERYGYNDLSELMRGAESTGNAADGALTTLDAPRLVSRLTDMVTDTRVSEAARAKMYYYATGRQLPPSTIMYGTMAEDGKGGYTVRSMGANGVVTSRNFKSRHAADLELGRIDRQAELNQIEIGERYQQEKDYDERLQEACRRVAAKHGWKPVEVYKAYEKVRDNQLRGGDKEYEKAERAILAKVFEEMGEINWTGVTDAMRNEINAKYDVDIDAAIRKDANRRTEAEQLAIGEYRRALLRVPMHMAYDAQPRLSHREQHLIGSGADPSEPIDPRFEQSETPNDIDPHKPAADPDAPKKAVGRATMKYQDRQVEVIDGRIVMTDDGTMVDNERSDRTIVIRDVETGKEEMVSPEAILTYKKYPEDNMEEAPAEVAPDPAAPISETHKYTSGIIKVRNADGSESRGVLTGYLDEDGRHEYYLEGQTDKLLYASDEELDAVLTEYTPDAPKDEGTETLTVDGISDAKDNPWTETVRGYSDEELSERIEELTNGAAQLTNAGRDLLDAALREQQRRIQAAQPEQPQQPEQVAPIEPTPAPAPTPESTAAPTPEPAQAPAEAPQGEVNMPTGVNPVGTISVPQRDGSTRTFTIGKDAEGNNIVVDDQGFMWAHDGTGNHMEHYRPGANVPYWTEEQLSKLGAVQPNTATSNDGFIPIDPSIKPDENGVITVPNQPENVPTSGETPQNPTENAVLPTESVPNPAAPVENVQETPAPTAEPTPLQRLPRNAKGEPIFEQAENLEHGWDALVEFAEGDAATAKEIADTMAEEKRKAYEKARKQKPKGKTPTEILASKKAISAGLAQAEQEYNLWQQMANVEQRRQDAIRAQQEAEARHRAAERAEAEKAEREAREEAARLEREALEGIPEWHLDTPENARKRGVRRFNGQMFTRQEPIEDNHPGLGREVDPLFKSGAKPVSARGRIFIGDVYDFQPSHVEGQLNPRHFVPEVQPKRRHEDGGVSVMAAKTNAENFRPELALRFEDAFNGVPVVNSRMEVGQGNGRTQMYRYLYEMYPEKGEAFKQTLIDMADEFGVSPDYIASIKRPMPSMMLLDITDEDFIRLGNIDDKEMTSGGIERIKPKNVAQKLGEDMRSFAAQLLRSGDEEASFGQLVDRNGTEVLKWMAQKGAITNTQYQSAFDSKGNLTAEAKNDLQKVLYQAVFKGGSQQLEEMFDRLPAKAQRAILSTAFRDMDSPLAGKMLPEIQASIAAFNQLMNDPAFAAAKKMEEVLRAVDGFKRSFQLDDRFEQYMPADNFSNFALHLAAMYKASDLSQSTLASYFNQMYDLAQGKKAATLFEEADTTEYPLAEVVNKVLGIDYQPAKNGNNNVANGGADVALHNQNSQGGELRGNEPPASGEQNPAGTEPSERGGRIVPNDAERGGQGDVRPTSGRQQRDLPKAETAQRAENLNRIHKWLTDENVEWAKGRSREEIFEHFGNDLEPVSVMPTVYLPLFGGEAKSNNVYSGKGYFIDHAANHHAAVPLSDYDNIQEVLDHPDAIKRTKQGSIAFVKKMGRYNAVVVDAEVDSEGRILLHKSFFTQRKEPYAKEDDIQPEDESREGGTSSISHADESAPAISLQSRRDVDGETGGLQTTASKPHGDTPISDGKVNTFSTEKQGDGNKNSLGQQIAEASKEVNTEPTEAQKEAGNYKKGHVRVAGYDISIEQPKGSVRRDKDANGKEWQTTMQNTYGYIRGTEGVDGDHIDVFLSDAPDKWNGENVYVVDQYNPDGTFDEHKVMLGFNSVEEARAAYLSNYEKGWEKGRRIEVTGLSQDNFRKWVESSHRKTKPFAEYKSVAAAKGGEGASGEVRLSAGAAKEPGSMDAYNVVRGLIEDAGIEVHEVSGEEAQAMLERARNGVQLMGSRVDKRMAEIGEYFDGKELTPAQQTVVDVFSGKTDNKVIEVERPDGTRRVVMRQGSENKAGTKHSLFRHYGTESNMVTADDIALIPDVIAKGERSMDGNRVSYNYTLADGTRLRVTTQLYKGREEFTNYLSNRKPLSSTSRKNTQLSARANDTEVSDAKLGNKSETGKSDVREYRTADGVVYGWTDGGKIYLNRDVLNAETPIHEYTHLWDAMVRRLNPKLWTRGKELMKQTPVWQEVVNDANYANIKDNEDEVASEVHSRLSGKDGAKVLEQMVEDAKKDGVFAAAEAVSLKERIKRWLRDMLSQLKGTFEKWTKKDLSKLTVEEFAQMPLRDLAEGVNPRMGDETMAGVHNITEGKLRKALKNGGLVNPSVAVTDLRRGSHEGYGEISLILPSKSLNKGRGNAGTWTADAYTPTYPDVERQWGKDGSKRAQEDIASVVPAMREEVRRGINSWMDGRDGRGLEYLFLHERGEAPQMEHRKRSYSEEDVADIISIATVDTGKELNVKSLWELTDKERGVVKEAYIKHKCNGSQELYDKMVEQSLSTWRSLIEKYPEGTLRHNGAAMKLSMYESTGLLPTIGSWLNDVVQDKNAGEHEMPGATTSKAVEMVRERGLEQEYAKWLEELGVRYGVKEVLFNGFTPDGTRKYVANTAANASKIMRERGRNAATGWSGSFQGFVAAVAEHLGKTSEMKIRKGRLTNDHAELDAFNDKWSPVYIELAQKCLDKGDSWDTYGFERLNEAAVEPNPAEYLRKEYGVYLSPMDVAQLIAMREAVRNERPAMYFETKFERPVQLSEFAAAVVPGDLSSDIREALESAGVRIVEYDRNTEGDRRRALMEASDEGGVRFHAMSRERAEFDAVLDRAVAERGIVMPGLAEKKVQVVEANHHPFEGADPIKQAREWAKENILGTHVATDSRGQEFEYLISNAKVNKYLSELSISKSENLGMHLSTLTKLPEIISESIEAEVHPDYIKGTGNKRSEAEEYTPGSLIHRFYGAVNIDGQVYRVKTTMIESLAEKTNKPHSYEITTVELTDDAAGQHELERTGTSNSRNSISSSEGKTPGRISYLPATKLLKGVEKSYDSGKKLLDESGMTRPEESTLTDEDSEPTVSEPLTSYNSSGNANFASRYETQDGKTVRYTSENPEAYGGLFDFDFSNEVPGAENATEKGRVNRRQQSNPPLQRRNAALLDTNASARLNEANGEYCALERKFRESNYMEFTSAEKVESADDVAFIFEELENASVENVFVVMTKRGVPTVMHISIGGFNWSAMNAAPVKLAFDRIKPDKVYFVHNHPSGALNCSPQDVDCLKKVENAIGKKAEGVIMDLKSGKYGTFDSSGTGSSASHDKAPAPTAQRRLRLYAFDRHVFNPEYQPSEKMGSAQDVAKFLSSHRLGDRSKVSVLVCNNQNQIVANVHTTHVSIDSKGLADDIIRAIGEFGGMHAFLYGDFEQSGMVAYRNLSQAVKERSGGVYNLLDVVRIEGNHTWSARDNGYVYEPGTEYGASPEGDIRFREVEDDAVLKEFAEGKTVKAYRTMQVIDGKLYSPMATKVGGKTTPEIKLGVPEQAEEHPEIIKKTIVNKDGNEQGIVSINKGLGKGSLEVAYNPYVHTSRTVLNDQFSSAYKRPNLVTVEVEVPESELTSGYRANMAKNTVGEMSWHSGTVSGQLAELGKPRRVILSRYDRPVRIVPFKEVAAMIAEQLDGTGIEIPYNVVQPQVRAELERLGVVISEEATGTVDDGDFGKAEYVTDQELEHINAHQQEMAQTSPEAKSSHAEKLAKKFNTPIQVVTDPKELTSDNAERQARMRRSKGFYDPATGKVVVVLPNNANVEDVAETVFHEVVAHKGLREMLGDENYDAFCDEVYDHLKDDLKEEVDRETTRRFEREPEKGYEHHRRVSVDELFGRMAEKDFEDFTKAERGIWAKLKAKVLEAINKFLGSLKLPKWVRLGDNELRYMLWRSHEKLRTKGDYVDMARDAVKRHELGLNGNDVVLTRSEENTNKQFNEQLKRWESGKMDSNEVIDVGKPMGILRHFMPYESLTLRQKVLSKSRKKHGLTAEDMLGLPGAMSHPIFVFKSTPGTVSVLTELRSADGENIFVAVEVGVNKQFGHRTLEVNDILSIHGREIENVVLPIVENNSLAWVDKKKGLDWLSSAKSNSQAIASQTLEDAAKVIKSFENPTIVEEESEYRFRDSETGDIWKDRSVGLQERITNAAIRLSNNQSGDLTLRNDAQKAVVNNLKSLLHSMRNRRGTAQSFVGADRKVEAGVIGAMNAQAMFDRATVKRVSDLARILMQNGYLSGMTSGEMQRMLSVVKNATAMHDIADSVQKIMDIMVGNQLRNAEGALRQLLSIRGSKVDARGVEVQGVLDVDGQRTMEVVKNAMSLPAETYDKDGKLQEGCIAYLMDEAQSDMSDSNQIIADDAAIRYAGLDIAFDYAHNIAESKADENRLREEIKKAKLEKDAGRMTVGAYEQFVETTGDAIRKNKIERAEAYFNLVGRLSDSLRGSIENAKAFREAEKARVSEIHHNANSDMEGRPTNEHHKDDWKDKFVNNGFVQFLFSPLGTFDQILRVFGNKSANGEGYLWNRFMRGWVDCRNKELLGVKEKFARLDEKAAELFGKGKTWGNLIRMEAKMPKATVSFWDGGEMRDHELTQGNLLYIYMVDKMTDGRMKLRRMGITEDDITRIENFLDPRFKALGDWLQDEFLVDTRNEYNETHKRMFGASMAAIENYFPLKILANARVDKEEDVNQQNRPDGITTKTGSIIKRRVNNLALDITGADALSVILDHITQMEHWNAYAEWNRDLNTLRTYKRFRNQVINMTTVYGGGRKLWENFNDLCLMAAGEYRPPVSKLNKSAVNLAKGVTAAKVSFRMYTALKQLLSAPAYIPEVSTSAIAKSIANPYGDFKWCLENMPIFRERWHSRISGDPRLLKSDMDWKMWRSRIMEISSRIGMTPNAFVDAVTVSIGARAMYETRLKQYLKEGYPTDAAEKRALQDATILFNQTQQSSESPFLSTMQVDKDWLSTMFTVFRNSSMSYTRQQYDAMRNLKRNLTPGQRAKSVEFMTKQILRDWDIDPDTATDAERDQAQGAANKRFRRQLKKDALRVATFGYILEWLWNLGPYLPYIIFGALLLEKDKMWDDAFTHAYFGSVEGLTGGDVMSSFGNMWASGEWNWNQLSKDMPLASDINTIGSKFVGGKNAEAINDILNLLVQMGVGMNPQSITDTAIAITDACGDDPALSHEAAIFAMRVLQVPQSQIDKMYFDEVDLTGEEASKLTPAQLAQRYAEYKVKRGTPLAPWSWGDEERLGKYNDLATDRMKERLDAQGDARVIEAYTDFEARYKAVSEKVKEAKALMKTDYAAAAQAHAMLQQDPDFGLYQRFGALDKQLGRISKMWLTSKTPEEAALVASTITSYRAGMVKVLQAETVESQQSAMSELTTLMNDFYAKYQGMQPKQVNR